MANLTATSNYHPQPYGLGLRTVFLPVQALAVVYEGAMVSQINGACVTATTALCGPVVGVAQEPVVTGGATDGAVRMVVLTDSIFLFNAGAIAPVDSTPYGTVLFADTDNTVSLGTTAVIAGRFMGIQDDGLVRVYISNQASWFDGLETEGTSRAWFARAVFTTTAVASYTGTGTGVLTAGSNAALVAQDGVTLAVGDVVMLQGGTLGSLAITAADTGPYVVSSLGSASTPFKLTRPTWFANGSIVPTSQSVQIGSEGTLFHNSAWKSTASPGCVVGTTDPAFYPDRVTQRVTLALSTFNMINVPIFSASASSVIAEFVGANSGSTTNTVGYGTIAPPTPGYIGTASAVVDALASGMGKNGTADTAILNVTIVNN
jgi:hypothetical protein